MHISRKGQQLMERWEGREHTAYQDSAGLWTIGVGHLIKADEEWMRSATLTDEQIDQLFAGDIAWAEAAVASTFPQVKHQSQFDALVSFTFNLGASAVAAGTLDDLINVGATPEDISAKWLSYNRAGGQVVNGLVERRKAEVQLYWSYLWQLAVVLLFTAAAMLAGGAALLFT
jgi:lysozyme